MTNEQTSGSTLGINTAVTASISVGSGGDIGFFGGSVQLTDSFEWDYQKTQQAKVGTAETATVTLTTSTVGYHDTVDVYFDTLFNSFAFIHPPISLVVNGQFSVTSSDVDGASRPAPPAR